MALDDSLFGINPTSLQMRINGVLVPAVILPGDGANPLADFQILYDPSTDFPLGESVQVQVDAEDIDGRAMTPDSYLFFVESGSGDAETNAPVLLAVDPADSATEVPTTKVVSFELQDDTAIDFTAVTLTVDPASAASKTFTLGDGRLSCAPTTAGNPNRVLCQTEPQLFATADTVALTIDAQDVFANAMTTSSTSFSVNADASAPWVRSRSPGPLSTGHPVGQDGYLELVDASSTVDPASVTVDVDGVSQDLTGRINNVAGMIQVTYDNSGSPWDYSATHTIALTASDDAVPPNTLSTSWTFDTDTGMRVVSTFPSSGAKGVPVGTHIEVAMENLASPAVTFDIGSLRFWVDSQEITPPPPDGSASAFTATYVPAVPFPFGKTVQVVVTVDDTLGYRMPPYSFSFRTSADVTPPQLRGLSPAPFASGVAADAPWRTTEREASSRPSASSTSCRLGAGSACSGGLKKSNRPTSGHSASSKSFRCIRISP